MKPSLEFNNCYCAPVGWPDLRGLTLHISPGEFFALTGPNGSAKATLCRCLAGAFRPTQGDIQFGGHPLPLEPYQIPNSGLMVVLQGERVFPEMSVKENLFSSPRTWTLPDRKQRLESVLELMPHLRDRMRQSAGTLSGGEQQMVAVARALMADPAALVLEEPSMGLAERVAHALYEALAYISASGRTVLVTEETLQPAAEYVGRAGWLDHGRIQHIGTPSDITAHSDHAATASLL